MKVEKKVKIMDDKNIQNESIYKSNQKNEYALKY